MQMPSGTVTFLFTDIEGGTRRWQEEPEPMSVAVTRHDDILRDGIAQHRGVVFKTVADAFCVAFASVDEAVAAALDTQIALAGEPWPTRDPLRVRMALHTGGAELRDDDYFGPTLNKVARIMATANGGQTLLSTVTAELGRDLLPPDAELLDLGAHPLKDIQRPERLFQLVHSRLPRDFPPLRAFGSLPNYTTPLVGRERETVAVVDLLKREAVRLVTLTGPGGIGKTRLALRVVDELAADFRDGVWLVGLAAVRDPALVAPTIAHALAVRESAGTSPFESLKGYLRDQHALLVLDSFERVAAAGPLVANLLTAAPGLVVLVTSRAVLRVRGEHEFSVQPLGLPSQYERDPEHSAAVALFAERARASNPSFAITKENAAAVAEICRRLEGLPLAIELAAARVRLLPPAALLSRLSSRLRLLTGGAADLPERQRTMRGAIDWGHDLLGEDEQTLFRRLAVFAGGWALDAAEEVAGEDLDLDVLDGMDSLLGQSFVRNLGGEGIEPRFAMLETIREYALEQLQGSGEARAVAARHAVYYLDLAERAAPHLRDRDQVVWLTRLESEHANFRAALRWADEQVDVDTVLRLSAALGGFWRVHCHFTEGRHWLERALSLSVGQCTALRATLLDRATVFARARGDYAPAEAQQTEAVQLQRELGDGDALASALKLLGALRYDQGDVAGARRLMEESLTVRQERGTDERAAAETMSNLGVLAHGAGALDASADYFTRGLAIFRRTGDDEGIARLVMNQGNLYLDRGDHQRAAALTREAITRFHGLGSTWDLVDCLDFLATNLGLRGRTEQAGTLFGASEALREAIGAVRPDPEQSDYEAKVAATRAACDADMLADAWAMGRTMTVNQTVAYALVDEEQG